MADYMDKISLGLGKNCGFFINGQFLDGSDFFASDSTYSLKMCTICQTLLDYILGFGEATKCTSFSKQLPWVIR